MSIMDVKEIISHLMDSGVCYDDIENELKYRDVAIFSSKWDENLCDYSDRELVYVAEYWEEVA